jgi:TolB-like protein
MSDASFSEKPAATPLPPLAEPDVALKPPKRSKLRVILVLVALALSHFVVLAVGFALGCLVTSLSSPSRGDSVAILPVSGDWQPQGAKHDWQDRSRQFLEVSIPDAIARDLVAQAPPGSLKVRATHELREHIGPDRQPSNVGLRLGVTAVLSGKVNRDGVLSVQLIAVDSSELLWSKTYQLMVDQNGNPTFQAASDISMNVRQKLVGRK